MIEKTNLMDKFNKFNKYWNPKLIGEVNDSAIRVVKMKGEFVWHSHENEDELFLVVKGKLLMKIKNQEDIQLEEGEMVIIPKGIEHMPVAEEETYVILVEPSTTINTGNVQNERTVKHYEKI